MTYSNPPPPPLPLPNMPPPSCGGNGGDFWPQPPMNNHFSNSQFEKPLPFKRTRNSVNNFAPLPPKIPRTNPSNHPVNKGTTHIFYKTRMCGKFMEGNCPNGINCTFAHGGGDLRETPENWQELVEGAGYANDDQRMIHRMKICTRFYNGEECRYGKRCNFLHERPAKYKTDVGAKMAMERTREPSVINVATMGPHIDHWSRSDRPEFSRNFNSSSDAIRVSITADADLSLVNAYANSDASGAASKQSSYKSKMCAKWKIGQCSLGNKCYYAHGQSDTTTCHPFKFSELNHPGRRLEAEPVMNYTVPIVAKNASVPVVSDGPPINSVATVAGPAKREDAAKGFFARWEGQKRISRVYADWIDDDDDDDDDDEHSSPTQVADI